MTFIKTSLGFLTVLFGVLFLCAFPALAEDRRLQSANLAISGHDSQIQSFSEETDELGMHHVRYFQKQDEVPIFGAQTIVHLNNDYSLSSISGRLASEISINTIPDLSEEAAIAKAETLWNEQFDNAKYDWAKTKLYIFNEGIVTNKNDHKNHLVWLVDMFQQDPGLHEYYFINALTGELQYQITGMQSAVIRDVWDCGRADGSCYLDAFEAFWPYTWGRSEGMPARGAHPWLGLFDTDNLYSYFGSLWTYYNVTFSRNGANNNGGMGDGTSFFPVANTSGLTFLDFVSSLCPNAFFNGENSVRFCAGYTTPDITGHEYAHAVNYFSILDGSGAPAGLTYSGESGALNESNSDVFGEAFEFYFTGSGNWEIGEGLPGGASRSMANPSKYTYTLDSTTKLYPNSFNDSNYYCGSSDYGGVHINSSVPNHAAYLMAIGGTFNSCTISGIGRAKEEAIFYRAETIYYTTNTDFNTGFNNIMQSCYDLYGAGSDCRQVKKALKSVEMDQGGACSTDTAVTPDCSAVDSPAIVSKITTPKKKGHYNTGKKIKIKVHFSKNVTSSGEVKVKLETGKKDRSCRFTITDDNIGSCRYKIKKGDKAKYLKVKKITGTLVDEDGLTLTDLKPVRNLPKSKKIVVDTKAPKLPKKVSLYRDSSKAELLHEVNPRKMNYIYGSNTNTPYFTWSKGRGGYSKVKYYFVHMSPDDLKKKDVKNKTFRQKKKNYQGYAPDIGREYKLYLVMKDKAGNVSKLKNLFYYIYTP